MPVEWSEDLATELTLVDDQHKEIFRRVNALLEACKTGKGKEAVGGMLSFVEEYVVSHFKAEEQFQRESAYPQYQEHRAMHERFLVDVKALKSQFEQEGPSLMTVLQTNKVVVDWLVGHIKKQDKAFAQYVKQYK